MLIVELVSGGRLAFDALQDPSWVRLMRHLKVQPPDPKTVKSDVAKVAAKTVEDLKDVVKNKVLCFEIDGWEGPTGVDAVAVSVSWTSDDFRGSSAVIEFENLKRPHSAQLIGAMVRW